jgi:hypothetical protein
VRLNPITAAIALWVSVAALCFGLFVGCGGCGTLDKGTPDRPSPYGGVNASGEMKTPDRVLFDMDLVLATSYDVLDNFLKWELANRAALAGSPEIKKAADKIRLEAPKAFKSAVAIRDAYQQNPSVQTRSDLTRALDVLHAMIAETIKYRVAAP